MIRSIWLSISSGQLLNPLGIQFSKFKDHCEDKLYCYQGQVIKALAVGSPGSIGS